MTKDEINCEKKRVFKTIGPANLEAALQYRQTGMILVPYQCNVCKLYHLTSKIYNVDKMIKMINSK